MEDRKYLDFTNNSFLIFKIRRLSQVIFAKWCENAKKEYATQLDAILSQTNETDIIDDVVVAFSHGIKCYLERLNDEERDSFSLVMHNYNIGFFYGVIQGRLNSSWHDNYILVISNEFKVVALLEAIKELMKIDDTTTLKTGIIYRYYLNKNKLPLDEADSDKILHLSNYNSHCLLEEFRSFSKDVLTDLSMKKYAELIEKDKIMLCPNINEYFAFGEIEDLLSQSEKYFRQQSVLSREGIAGKALGVEH